MYVKLVPIIDIGKRKRVDGDGHERDDADDTAVLVVLLLAVLSNKCFFWLRTFIMFRIENMSPMTQPTVIGPIIRSQFDNISIK